MIVMIIDIWMIIRILCSIVLMIIVNDERIGVTILWLDNNLFMNYRYILRHRLASLSVAMSELFLTYIVLFLKYIKLFLKYLKLFLKHTAKTAKSMS